jgi:hypothetical protein
MWVGQCKIVVAGGRKPYPAMKQKRHGRGR